MMKDGVNCSLLTGQERNMVANETHLSCTVEMCDLNRRYDVAVLDEIQLISDTYRGSAWTNALLGVQADEIHLCGDERALKLVHKICDLTGDTLIKKKYSRRSDLIVQDEHIHSVSQLRKGDCIIAFSKRKLLKLKQVNNCN